MEVGDAFQDLMAVSPSYAPVEKSLRSLEKVFQGVDAILKHKGQVRPRNKYVQHAEQILMFWYTLEEHHLSLGCLAVTPLLFNGNQALLLLIPRRPYLAIRTAAQYGSLSSIPQKQVPVAFGGATQLHGTAKTACRDALQSKGGPQQNLIFEPKESV